MPDQSYAATEHALLEEIARPLERLGDDPLELVGADFPTAMRGYDKAAVDEYVLHTSQLVDELQSVRSPESAVRRALVRAGGQISGVLRRAHETAAEITARSRSEAEDRLERARAEADEIMDAAERRVRDLDADTDRIWLDRQRIMADVEDLSNQLLGLARQAGERFPDDDQGPYDDEPAEPTSAADERVAGGEQEREDERGGRAGDGSETWTPVESAARNESIARDRSAAPEEPAAWERWADHDMPATGDAATGEATTGEATTGEATTGEATTGEATTGEATTGDTEPRDAAGEQADDGGTALTDREETLPLGTSGGFDASEPPEVEPRSARLSRERGSEDERGDADPGSRGVIPPMSEAANRPRRT